MPRGGLLMLMLALALALALGAPACGGGSSTTTSVETRTAAPAAATAPPGAELLPTGDVVELDAGLTYATRNLRPGIVLGPGPEGWIVETGDRPDHVSFALDVRRGQGILGFHRLRRVFDAERGGVQPGDMVEGPRDAAAWLSSHPHLRATKPQPVRMLGLAGVQIDVRARSRPPSVPDECVAGSDPCLSLFHDGFDDALLPEDALERFFVLQLPDGELVVDQYVEPASRRDEIIPRLDALLETVRLTG